MKNSKTKMITGALCLLILSTGFIIYGANPVLKQGKGLKKVSNDKYTFGDIGENLGHRLYNQDGTIISRSNNAIKRAHGNGNIIVTYNRIDVCSNKYQSVKGDIGPLIFVAADLADWNNPLLKWDTGVTSFRYRQPGNIGKGKYNFHFDNVSNPGLSKLDGTLWREGIDFSYDGNLSGIYNIGNGFTIYEDGEEITSKIEKVGSGNGFDGEILTDIGNNEIYSVKGRNWCTKNGTVWRWGALTDPINGIIKSGESISENSGIFGPTATNGFCLFINGKEITSYASEIANEKLTNTGIGAYQTKHSNWCSKQGNDFSISANIVSNYGKANGFVIKDAYGNDVCSKEQKSYILPDSRDHSSLTPVVADLLNWTSVSVPKGKVYVDPVKGRVKFFSGNETIDYAQSIDNQIFSFNYVGAPTVGGFASVNNWNNHEIASFSLILPFHVPVNSIFNFQIDLYTPGLGYCEFYFVKKKVMPYGLIYERIASLGSVATLPSGWSTINCLYNEALKILYSSDTYLLMIETGERPDWTAFPI